MNRSKIVKMNDNEGHNKGWYYLFLIGGFLASGGIFLLVEHLVSWERLEFEILGHETYGLVCVLAGVVLMVKHVYYLFFEKNNKE